MAPSLRALQVAQLGEAGEQGGMGGGGSKGGSRPSMAGGRLEDSRVSTRLACLQGEEGETLKEHRNGLAGG